MNNTKHTASFLASGFLASKRSLKSVYGLTIYHGSALRYICASIDMDFNTKGHFHTFIYLTQIAKYSRMSLRKCKSCVIHLIKKRLIIRDKNKYSIGKVLIAGAPCAPGIDRGTRCTSDRWVHSVPLSKSSNFTNRSKIKTENKKQKSEFQGLAKSGNKASDLLEQFMNQDSKGKIHG